jgi:hypothetical protein
MTTTRFTFARRASQLVWLLPLGLAGLATACGSSPSMIGTSAGAAGASAGNAGSSSATGGSGSDHAGAGATTAGGPSELGGASTGGASTGGATSTGGLTSTGGSSELGGASTGGATSGGATGSGGSGGSGVGACTVAKDCATGYDCLFKIADGCTAKGSCFKMPGGALCASVSPYCGCSGQTVYVPCYEPAGYAPAPVSSQQSSATCPATPTPDAACVGKACGASCGTGQVPSICDSNGKCIPGVGVNICN